MEVFEGPGGRQEAACVRWDDTGYTTIHGGRLEAHGQHTVRFGGQGTSHYFTTPKIAAMAARERGVSGAGCYKITGRAYMRP